MRGVLKISLVLLLPFMFGCKSGKPSDAVLQNAVERNFDDLADNTVKLTNFRIINGFQPSENVYEAEASYDIQFLVDYQSFLYIAGRQFVEENGGQRASELESRFFLSTLAITIGLKYGKFEPGETYRENGARYIMRNTDKGWRVHEMVDDSSGASGLLGTLSE